MRSEDPLHSRLFRPRTPQSAPRGVKNTHAHGYPWVISVMSTGRVAKRVSTGIINGYLTTHYYMDTDTNLIVSIPTGTHI